MTDNDGREAEGRGCIFSRSCGLRHVIFWEASLARGPHLEIALRADALIAAQGLIEGGVVQQADRALLQLQYNMPQRDSVNSSPDQSSCGVLELASLTQARQGLRKGRASGTAAARICHIFERCEVCAQGYLRFVTRVV